MSLILFLLYRTVETAKLLIKIYNCYKKHFTPRLALCCDMVIQTIPESTMFPHPFGIAIRGNTKLGENVTIRQNVTIGARRDSNEPGCIIGDNVLLCANSLILGPVKIGNNAIIGAGAIVLKDVPAGMTITGIWK